MKLKRHTLAVCLVLTGLILSTAPAFARQMDETSIAVLRTIDKVSARTRTFEVPIDKTVKFGNSLFIRLRACRKAPPLEPPESAAFLQIWERKPEEEKSAWVFSGWMFASNPSLSAMDHPVYDVWLIDCKNEVTSSKPQDFTSETAPEGKPEGSEDAPVAEDAPAAEDKKEEEEKSPAEKPLPGEEPAPETETGTDTDPVMPDPGGD